ncbi:unnamed protein product [Moneuplotes crassus]|uniref:Uncharacterized protein n=1 Tax=Euplotes crassus TaxID=5936 RepID=A0AAD1UPM8_EUPCR|nr:unnamed protein product [Moneuplotes crassus]
MELNLKNIKNIRRFSKPKPVTKIISTDICSMAMKDLSDDKFDTNISNHIPKSQGNPLGTQNSASKDLPISNFNSLNGLQTQTLNTKSSFCNIKITNKFGSSLLPALPESPAQLIAHKKMLKLDGLSSFASSTKTLKQSCSKLKSKNWATKLEIKIINLKRGRNNSNLSSLKKASAQGLRMSQFKKHSRNPSNKVQLSLKPIINISKKFAGEEPDRNKPSESSSKINGIKIGPGSKQFLSRESIIDLKMFFNRRGKK